MLWEFYGGVQSCGVRIFDAESCICDDMSGGLEIKVDRVLLDLRNTLGDARHTQSCLANLWNLHLGRYMVSRFRSYC